MPISILAIQTNLEVISFVYWLQGCKGDVGPEDWTLKGFWICFFQKSAGT